MIDWLIDWLFPCPIDWLIDWLNNFGLLFSVNSRFPPTAARGYYQNPNFPGESRERNDRRASLSSAGQHDADYFTRDIYMLSPDGNPVAAANSQTDRLTQLHATSPREANSQSSGSVIYNSSHKRSLEMVMRDCSPVSDEEAVGGHKKHDRKSSPSELAGPDSTTVCDMDIRDVKMEYEEEKFEEEKFEEDEEGEEEVFAAPTVAETTVAETDFNEIIRLTGPLISAHTESPVRHHKTPGTGSMMQLVENVRDDGVMGRNSVMSNTESNCEVTSRIIASVDSKLTTGMFFFVEFFFCRARGILSLDFCPRNTWNVIMIFCHFFLSIISSFFHLSIPKRNETKN